MANNQQITNNPFQNQNVCNANLNLPVFKPFKEFEMNGNVATEVQYQSISSMVEFSNKSFEELRYQHYLAKRQNILKK